MRILVTGGKGFLGRVLIQKLQLEGYTTISVSSEQCDLSQANAVQYLPTDAPDYVFHLAGKTGILSSWEHPEMFYRANVDTTRTVLEYCRQNKTPLHYVSSYIYGNQGAQPISEEAPVQPNNPYAHSKWIAEEMCRFYVRFFSMSITISRPFNIYGPSQPAHFFIPRMIQQLRTQDRLQANNLNSKRDYVFVEDVADSLIAIMRKGKTGDCYNIGSGTCFSCREVIELLQSLLGRHQPIFSEDQTWHEEILHAQANRDKISKELGWHPQHSLHDGLIKCL